MYLVHCLLVGPLYCSAKLKKIPPSVLIPHPVILTFIPLRKSLVPGVKRPISLTPQISTAPKITSIFPIYDFVNSRSVPSFIVLLSSVLQKHDLQCRDGGHTFFLHDVQIGILNSPLRINAKNSSKLGQLLRITTLEDVPAAARLWTRAVLHPFTCL